MQISVFAATLKDAKANAAATISEKSRDGYGFTRMNVRKTGNPGLGAYVVEITFAREDAA